MPLAVNEHLMRNFL